MFPSVLPTAALILALTSIFTGCGAGCNTYGSRPMAVVGEPLTLQCTVFCSTIQYKWTLVTESANITLENETKNTLKVSSNVTVEEVGGKLYGCQCVNGDCQLFRIGVKPVGDLFFSSSTVKTGSRVNVTCKAQGYPPTFIFEVTHRDNKLPTVPLPGGKGVYVMIESTTKNNSGEYQCIPKSTLQEYPNNPLQGDEVTHSLTVYDPPFISCTDNDTVVYSPDQYQTAVLECAVDNREGWLTVSVNWTTAEGMKINASHTIAGANNVSYLLLHNISKKRNNFYSCNVYSDFGFEDKKVLQVIFSEPVCRSEDPASSSNCTSDTPTTTDHDCDRKEKSHHFKYLIIPIPVLVAALGVWFVLTVLFGKYISEYSLKFLNFMKNGISNIGLCIQGRQNSFGSVKEKS